MSESRLAQPQAEHVKRAIEMFGGPLAVATILNIDRSNVYKWKRYIPGDHVLTLLK